MTSRMHCWYGCTKVIMLDCQPSQAKKDKHIISSTCHPQTNGLVDHIYTAMSCGKVQADLARFTDQAFSSMPHNYVYQEVWSRSLYYPKNKACLLVTIKSQTGVICLYWIGIAKLLPIPHGFVACMCIVLHKINCNFNHAFIIQRFVERTKFLG